MSIQYDSRQKTEEAVVAWILTVLTLGYMLPWAVAATRGKSNSAPIALVNFFLGWTIIGWVIALVMACGSHQVVSTAPTPAVAVPPQVWIDPATGHTLTMNAVTGQPMRINPATGQAWVEPAASTPETEA